MSVGISCFLFLGIFSTSAPAQPSVSKDQVLEILAQEEILNVEQRARLKEFSNQLSNADLSLEELQALAAALSQKFNRDLKNLSGLTYNLTELLDNGYAQKIGKVRRRDIDDIIERIEQLKGASKSLYAPKALADDRPNKDEIVKIFTRDLAALTGEGGLPGTQSIWQSIKDKFAPAYERWNEHYQKLEESHLEPDNISETYGLKTKKKFYEESVGSAQEYVEQRSRYKVEQLEFLRDFTRAQVIFRRLSSPNSGDF